PAMPFIIDGGIYINMAQAMATEGALAIAGNGGVEDAPPLTKYLTRTDGALVYPQYPSGYGFIAAPFYLLFGVRGLMLMNALALAASVFLTADIAKKLFRDDFVKYGAAAILLFATYVSNYAVAIWPHMLSLAVWLGAVDCLLKGLSAKSARAQQLWLYLAGLTVGLGFHIRVDTVLLLAALLVWLKLIARPADRMAPLWIVAGAAPWLAMAAWLNYLKFGALTPLTYGSSAGATNLSGYASIIIAGAVTLTTIWLLNAPRALLAARQIFSVRIIWTACALAICTAAIAFHGFVWRVVDGAYVLIINLQAHDAYVQAGVERNEYGHLLFWGYPKKALIQSIPFLPLALIPVVRILHKDRFLPVSLCLTLIAAPIAFYSLNQWHGGGSYNMRYFIPTLPFIAMLCASALRDIIIVANPPHRREALFIAVVAALLFLGAQHIGDSTPALYAPAALYPQWALAAICAGAVVAFLWRRSRTNARATMLSGLFCIAYSAFLSLENAASHEKARAELQAHAQEIAKVFPEGALVL
ncbi:MAG: hypothetical protein ACX939_12770, partial [Hyphococcus sp.]